MSLFKGFTKGKDTTEFNFDYAINIKDVKYRRVKLDEFLYGDNKYIPLPVGFVVQVGGEKRRITEYEFDEVVLKGANAEIILEKAEEKARDAKATVQKLASFLSKTVKRIGEYDLKQIKEITGKNPESFFLDGWLADIFTMFLSARYIILGEPLAIAGLQCPCPRKEIIYDDPDNGRPLHSLFDIETKVFDMPLNEEVLFYLELEDGLNDGKSIAKRVYCQPLRLNHLASIADAKSQETTKLRTLQKMVVAIPESEVYGIRRTNVLSEDVYRLFSRKDRRNLEEIIKNLQPGPINNIDVYCHNCLESPRVSYTLPWINQTSLFLYSSDQPDIPDNV